MTHSCHVLGRLGKDMSLEVFKYLDEPTDVAKLCCVSKSWYRFVIENELCKQFCLNLCPEASKIIKTNILGYGIVGSLERDHKVFSILAFFLWLYRLHFPIKDYVCESSTRRRLELQEKDNSSNSEDYHKFYENYNDYFEDFEDYEEEQYPGYWYSGESDPTAQKTVVYELIHSLCIVSAIHVKAYEDMFYPGLPMFFPKAVRFSVGYHKSSIKQESTSISSTAWSYDDDSFIWTCISSEYPLAQESVAQEFHLQRPYLCAGGMLKMELLGGLPETYLDGICYRRKFAIRAVGLALCPMFDIDIADDIGSFILKCDWPKAFDQKIQMLKTARQNSQSFKVIPCRLLMLPQYKAMEQLVQEDITRRIRAIAELL